MNRIMFCGFLVLCAFFSNCHSTEVGVDTGGSCVMPFAEFKFSYLDSLIRQVQKPTDSEFLKGVSKRMDPAKEEIYLWYVLRNKRLVKSFFKKLTFKEILDQDENSLNAILWIMSHTNNFFSEKFTERNVNPIKDLDLWSKKYKRNNPSRYLVMTFYVTRYISRSALAEINPPSGNIDVDLLVRLGIMSENNNRGLDALYYYTQAAGYGYQGGLVGAAIRLPAEGGNKCIQRAAYYVLLSGATGPVIWWTH